MYHPTLPVLVCIKPWDYRYRDSRGMRWMIESDGWYGWAATDKNYEPGNPYHAAKTVQEAVAAIEQGFEE